jgi:hypothetical protein
MEITRVKGRQHEVRRLLARQSGALLEVYQKSEEVDALACLLQRALADMVSKHGSSFSTRSRPKSVSMMREASEYPERERISHAVEEELPRRSWREQRRDGTLGARAGARRS